MCPVTQHCSKSGEVGDCGDHHSQLYPFVKGLLIFSKSTFMSVSLWQECVLWSGVKHISDGLTFLFAVLKCMFSVVIMFAILLLLNFSNSPLKTSQDKRQEQHRGENIHFSASAQSSAECS